MSLDDARTIRDAVVSAPRRFEVGFPEYAVVDRSPHHPMLRVEVVIEVNVVERPVVEPIKGLAKAERRVTDVALLPEDPAPVKISDCAND